MSATALVVTQLKSNTYAVQAGDLAVTMASDTGNGNTFAATGREIIIAQNTDASPHTFTITSTQDHLGRTGDITTYSVPANTVAAIQMTSLEGWQQSDKTVQLSSSHATLKFGVLRLV